MILKLNAKIWKFVRIVTVLLFLIVTLCVVIKNHFLASAFQNIEKGVSKDEVIAMMGRPNSESICSDHLMWLDTPVKDLKCIIEIRYDAWFMPEFWTVGFNAKNRAVAKYHYVSP